MTTATTIDLPLGGKNRQKIHENMCFDVFFLHENITTCLFACNFLCFKHFYPPITSYRVKVY